MEHRFDTIVIGAGGAMGSAACFHLARRGIRVLGIDQFGIAHTRGSSHGLSRMIRMCYYEHPDYVPLLRRAYELWRELEAESGERVLFTPGGIYMGREDSEAVAGSHRAAIEHNLPHEILSHADLARRYPQFVLPNDFVGLFEPAAGWVVPERAIAAHARLAIARGANLHTNEPVLDWIADSSGVRVRTDKSEYHAATLIIAAGAWATRVARAQGVNVAPTRQALTWFRPLQPRLFTTDVLPVWAIQAPEEFGSDLFYGFPMSGESELGDALKLARHARGPDANPDTPDRSPTPADEADIRPFLARFIPEASGPHAETSICIYENSPDGHFIIDRHPSHANVVIAAGFSGHGFKFASVIGQVLADLAQHGRTDHPIGFLSSARFTH